jgi:hypothetical protein
MDPGLIVVLAQGVIAWAVLGAVLVLGFCRAAGKKTPTPGE